jgi:hypothetical protein
MIEKLEKIVLKGKIIEEYPERQRVLIFGIVDEDDLPVHVVVDCSEIEEPVFVASYVPDRRHWIKFQIRKKLKVISMEILKKRKCPECGGEMAPKLITLLYKRN